MSNENVSPAQELRAAASKIRNTAALAASGDWDATSEFGIVKAGPTAIVCTANGRSADRATALHIAMWHPGVAEAVADWLATAAAIAEQGKDPSCVHRPIPYAALRVARAINGGA